MSLIVKIKKQLDNFMLSVDMELTDEVVSVIGMSGSGKSMTLKCIAGIETPDSGFISLNGRVLYDSKKRINLQPGKRRVGYLFQDYALFPTMTVMENICIAMGQRNEEKVKGWLKSGVGAYAVQLGELKVGAVVTLNALGDIYDIDTDKKIAGALDENGLLFDDETAYFEAAAKIQNMFTGNTTIGTIITNAKLDKTALGKVASMAHNGYGRAIRPVHTMADGDSIYAVSVGSVPADINLVGPMSAYVMAKAIANAARSAKSVDGYKAFCDVNKK